MSILPPGVDMIQWCLSTRHMEETLVIERQRAKEGMGRVAVLHAHAKSEGACNEECCIVDGGVKREQGT